MRLQPLAVSLILLTPLAPGLAAAQDSNPSDGRVSLAVIGGASVGSGAAGAALGATLLFDVSRRVAIEARSVYMDRGPGSSAMDLTANVLVKLLDRGRANPYLSVGGGAYVAMFDLGSRQLFGMIGAGVPAGSQLVRLFDGRGWGAMPGAGMMGWPSGQTFGPGWMMGSGFTWNNTTQAGPTFAGGEMPMFYARRMGDVTVPSGGWHMRSFTDPALSFGGGVNVDLRRGMYVRPDVRVLTIFGGGETIAVTAATFSFGYRF